MATVGEPKLTIMNSTDSVTVSEWHLGTIKAATETTPMVINVWNNRGGITTVSDLQEMSITTKNVTGGDDEEQLVVDKWVQCLVNDSTDGYIAIGGTDVCPIAHKNASGTDLSNQVLKGTANDGTTSNSSANYAKVSLKVVPPINATAGSHSFKVRIQGYYV